MQHVQGYFGSHWTLPCHQATTRSVSPAMATISKTTMQNVPSLLAVSMIIAMQWYHRAHRLMEEVSGFFLSH
jgi:hypothetical protein